jgi:hypothetical protein
MSESREAAPGARGAELVLIGYWASPEQPGWPDPARLVDESWDSDERESVACYLRWGLLYRGWCGPSRCRLCGERNGSVDLTDGVYVWPEGLFHYVAAHSVRLPREFVDHARAHEGRFYDVAVTEAWWRSQTGVAARDGRPTSG